MAKEKAFSYAKDYTGEKTSIAFDKKLADILKVICKFKRMNLKQYIEYMALVENPAIGNYKTKTTKEILFEMGLPNG